jgi:hypothetical protein
LKSAEFSADFFILCGFLDALFASGVPLYADEAKITPSASEWLQPCVLHLSKNLKAGNSKQKTLLPKLWQKRFCLFDINSHPSKIHHRRPVWD